MRLRRRSRRKGSKVKAEVMGYLGIWESGRSMVLFFFLFTIFKLIPSALEWRYSKGIWAWISIARKS